MPPLTGDMPSQTSTETAALNHHLEIVKIDVLGPSMSRFALFFTPSSSTAAQQSSSPVTQISRLAHPVSLPMLMPAMPPCIIPSCCASTAADSRAIRSARVSCCIIAICEESEAEPGGIQNQNKCLLVEISAVSAA